MHKFSQYSLFDSLMDIMPGLRFKQTHNGVSSKAASAVYEIWKHKDHKINNKEYERPTTIAKDKIDSAQKEGLIRQVGHKVEITDKGSEILKIMVLGDDASSFDKTARDPDFMTAVSKMKPVTAEKKKFASEDLWWERFLDQ